MRRDKLVFIGVSSAGSAIMRIFPRWAQLLGLDCDIVGWDLPLRAPAQRYRNALDEIQSDPAIRGALITAHKIDMLAACGQSFAALDEDARLCDEVSCIVKRGGKLLAYAKDPGASAQALAHFVPAGHWRAGDRDALCLGAGGAAIAISIALARARPADAYPRRMLFTDVLPERLAAIERIHRRLDTPIEFVYQLSRCAADNDALLRELGPASLVINATGLGKDLPGSPLSASAQFPRGGLVWELNYRGERDFMRQAQAQATARSLTIEDGWTYFLRGWSDVIAEIFGLDIDAATFGQMRAAANLAK